MIVCDVVLGLFGVSLDDFGLLLGVGFEFCLGFVFICIVVADCCLFVILCGFG